LISLKELNPRGLPLTDEQKFNQRRLFEAVNKLRALYGKPMVVTSGVRDAERQKEIDTLAGRRPRLGSAHIKGAAADFRDPDGELKAFIKERGGEAFLAELGLYMEAPEYTVGYLPDGPRYDWVHLQVTPPASGKRIFQPYAFPPPQPPKVKK
jgi:hypothetical protein